MTKAVEKAYEAYPLNTSNRLNHERNAKRLGYQQGYEQAEKDLALTWEDVRRIILIHERMATQAEWKYVPVEQFYTEVLKRFLERKNV